MRNKASLAARTGHARKGVAMMIEIGETDMRNKASLAVRRGRGRRGEATMTVTVDSSDMKNHGKVTMIETVDSNATKNRAKNAAKRGRDRRVADMTVVIVDERRAVMSDVKHRAVL